MNENNTFQVGDRFTVGTTGHALNPEIPGDWFGLHAAIFSTMQEVFANKGGALERVVMPPFNALVTQQIQPGDDIWISEYQVTVEPNEPVFPGDFGGVASIAIATEAAGPFTFGLGSALAPPIALGGLGIAVLAVVVGAILGGAVVHQWNVAETEERQYQFVLDASAAGVDPSVIEAALELEGGIFSGARGALLAAGVLVIAWAVLSATKS
tara:strand:- start:6322 stop:6954 length:633 start_codon:yes stop_codon:yes gene_type:complete